jgi:putative tricarboxylic transport membrane protein
MVLGVVLGNLMEQNLRRALSITNGELHILWSSPVTVSLWSLAAIVLLVPPLLRKHRAWRLRQGG